jgi:predicted Rossmann fold flavoprotein
MAAIFAAAAGAETVLIERTRDCGRKILISGGGRCNILPARLDESRFITDSSANTLRKIIRSWPLHEQIDFFESELGIALVEETESAKLFPASHRARDVRDGLLTLAARRGARLLTNTLVTGLAPMEDGRWRIGLDQAPAIEADAVIVATGGLSVPNTGSDGIGLSIIAGLGHTIHPTYPALTPLTAEPAPFAELAGISLNVRMTARSAVHRYAASGGFLFTHHGYSGPAVLNVSHVASRSLGGELPAQVQVAWTQLDDKEWEHILLPHGNRTVLGAVRGELPDRLAVALLGMAGVNPARSLADLRRQERIALIETLVRCVLPWTGDDGYKKAEVTGGGVSLAEIDPRTMESRRQPHLFLCGEVLDAFGPIGGYNFLWAWATGRAAGIGAAGYVA